MKINPEVPASAGMSLKPDAGTAKGGKQTEIIKPGNRDKRFGPQKKLGQDGCGY